MSVIHVGLCDLVIQGKQRKWWGYSSTYPGVYTHCKYMSNYETFVPNNDQYYIACPNLARRYGKRCKRQYKTQVKRGSKSKVDRRFLKYSYEFKSFDLSPNTYSEKGILLFFVVSCWVPYIWWLGTCTS